jgi:hypothetical protein
MMATFKVIGYVNDDGKLEFEIPQSLTPGSAVEITLDIIDEEAEAIEDAKWDELLARPEAAALLKQMAEQAQKDFLEGRTEKLDPDTLF